MRSADVIAIAVVFVAAVVQSGVGFGFALVASPVLAAVVAPSAAVPTIAALALGVNAMTLATERRPSAVRWRTSVLLILGSLPGLALGAVVLTRAPDDALRILIAVVVLASVAARARGEGRAAPGDERVAVDLAVGAASGALATSTGINGPPMVLRLLHLRATPDEIRDTLAAVFVASGVLTLVVLALAGALEFARIPLALAAAAVAGQFVGRPVFLRLGARHDEAVLVLLALTALLGLAPAVRAVI